jgi:predicted enzyme related to lactoylglutathione lyase
MINGLHAMVFAKNADRVRAFFRDVLEFPCIDAGGGWLIFGLPPAELGVHPTRGKGFQELYLMCADLKETVTKLKRKGVKFAGRIRDQGWGLVTTIKLPGGGELGLYEPKHPTMLSKRRRR